MIHKPHIHQELASDKKYNRSLSKLSSLIEAINQKNVPQSFSDLSNQKILELDRLTGPVRKHRKALDQTYQDLMTRARKELNLVTKNYYQNLWMALGLSVFGVPMGIGLSFALRGDISLMGAFLAMGLPIGLAIGAGMDKKAAKEGRQLDI